MKRKNTVGRKNDCRERGQSGNGKMISLFAYPSFRRTLYFSSERFARVTISARRPVQTN